MFRDSEREVGRICSRHEADVMCRQYRVENLDRKVHLEDVFIGIKKARIRPLRGRVRSQGQIQGGSNMTGTNCDLFTHK
jgi:hypothetical protein